MAKLETKISGIDFKNPVTVASGTFGYGTEFSDFFDVTCPKIALHSNNYKKCTSYD